MQADRHEREFILHKVKKDFEDRLATLHGYSTEVVEARVNGQINSDRFFLDLLGMQDEFTKLEDYYNPDNYELVYDAETTSWRYARKLGVNNG
ncbi:hypothetical protein H5S09_04070 [Limosilactobacillus sp. STM2_1]|uniref:Uncharacterized protein n=1 Tax=Limosilactobacillus rudii TaxID=2759755 RepID=A0A7W3UL94_9LACO|nr:hypothetical protein [Limosilactobacillus rudii]MBB1078939.1 hypothetical protein [Limosilactobacillus rudii]MBB1097120.1 hypothetical protein [Limosilactobacillus rudii]MCD7134113.1 hypothetical protein [Limosilactobacillus rudii]